MIHCQDVCSKKKLIYKECLSDTKVDIALGVIRTPEEWSDQKGNQVNIRDSHNIRGSLWQVCSEILFQLHSLMFRCVFAWFSNLNGNVWYARKPVHGSCYHPQTRSPTTIADLTISCNCSKEMCSRTGFFFSSNFTTNDLLFFPACWKSFFFSSCLWWTLGSFELSSY